MKIGCDIRFFYDETAYSVFVRQFLFDLIAKKPQYTFFLYSNEVINIGMGNVVVKVVREKREGIIDEFKFAREIKKD